MNSVAVTLGILILWRNRYRLGLVVLATTLFAAMIHWQWDASRELVGISLVCTFYFLFGVLCNTSADSTRGFSGVSPYFLSLPVRTSTVVLVHLVVAFAVIGIALCLWFGLVLRSVTWSFSFLELVVFLWAGFSVFASLVWGLARVPKIRMASLVIGFFLMLGLSLGPLGLNAGSVAFWGEHRSALWIGMVALTIFCPLGFLPLISSDRSGGSVRSLWSTELWYRVQPWRWIPCRPISSPSKALFLKELTQTGWLLPGAMLLLVGMANLIGGWRYFWWGKVQDEFSATLTNALIFSAVVIGALFQGLLVSQFGRSVWSENRRMTTFQGVLPVSSEAMVIAKFKVSLVSLAASWVLVLFGVSFWYWVWDVIPPWEALSAAHYRGFESGDALPFLVLLGLALVLSWRSMTALLWLGMLGRRGAVELGLVLVLVQVGLLVSLATWEGNFRSPRVVGMTTFLFYVWMVAKLVVCAVSVRALGGVRESLRSYGVGYLLCWFVGTLAAVGSADWLSRFLGCPRFIVYPAMIVIMPLGSVFAAFAAGGVNRHQK